MKPRVGRARATALLFASTVAVCAFLAGCVSPRNALGTTSNPCYRAVPVASEAVHDRGKLAGVRLVGQKELDRYPHMVGLLDARAGRTLRQVCVVSFHGRFRLDDVNKPAGPTPANGTGPVAIVVVTDPGNALVATFVLEREPLPLRHEVLGTHSSSPSSPSSPSSSPFAPT